MILIYTFFPDFMSLLTTILLQGRKLLLNVIIQSIEAIAWTNIKSIVPIPTQPSTNAESVIYEYDPLQSEGEHIQQNILISLMEFLM